MKFMEKLILRLLTSAVLLLNKAPKRLLAIGVGASLLIVVCMANAGTLNLTFHIVPGTQDTNYSSINIRYGTNAGVFIGSTNIGTNLTVNVPNFPAGTIWWFQLQFLDAQSNVFDSVGGYYGTFPPTSIPASFNVTTN